VINELLDEKELNIYRGKRRV